MPNDPKSSSSFFDSPASQVEALRFPDGLRDQLKELYDQTLPESQEGGMKVTSLRLTRALPSGLKTEGPWEKRDGWAVCMCSVTAARFAVPEGEPVPALETTYRCADGTEPVFHRAVHPDLAADRAKLAERLVAKLGRSIQERLLDLIGVAAKLEALSEMEELPGPTEEDSGPEHPGRYEPIDDPSV